MQIRLAGLSAQSARAAASGIGPALLNQLNAPKNARLGMVGRAIGRIDAGKFSVAPGIASSELRELIAQRIADSIRRKHK